MSGFLTCVGWGVCRALHWMVLGLVLCGKTAGTQTPRDLTEEQVKAMMVLQITRFVESPLIAEGEGPIRVCVLGSDRFVKAFDAIAQNELVHGRAVAGQLLRRMEEVDDCPIVFIAAASDRDLQALFDGRYRSGGLTLSDIERFAVRGGMVGMVSEGGRIVLEINPAAASRSNVKFSSKLLRLARVIGRIKERE